MKQKKIKWLVSDLPHISDHGLAMVWTDEQKQAWMQSLKKDGETTLMVGESHIKIKTVGRVTFTDMFRAHGSYKTHNIHYFDEASGLKFTFKKTDDEFAFDTLKSIILGGGLPSNWNQCKQWGSSQDELRKWLKKYVWTLSGENGLRAKAMELRSAAAKEKIRLQKAGISGNESRISVFNLRNFDKEIADKRTRTKERLSFLDGKIKEVQTDLDDISRPDWEPSLDSDASSYYKYAKHRGYGVRCANVGYGNEDKPLKFSLEGSAGVRSHQIMSPNYSIKWSDDGKEFILSSGIKCDIKPDAVLAWLKGERPAPSGTYGTCSKVEVSNSANEPVVLIKCGCHYIDGSSLNDEFKELLKPTHTVTVSGAVRALRWDEEGDREEFVARLKAECNKQIDGHKQGKEAHAVEFFQFRKLSLDLRNNKETHLQKMNEDVAKAKAVLAQFESDLAADTLMNSSGSIEDLNNAMLCAVNALVGIRA